MFEDKFYKVYQTGGTYVTATFFNPVTDMEYTKCVRDYGYADCSRDDDEAYYMRIDQEANRLWRHKHGLILVGDLVRVVKGRKLPIGYKGRIVSIKAWKDNYGRIQAYYAYFKDGSRTNVNNLELVKESTHGI